MHKVVQYGTRQVFACGPSLDDRQAGIPETTAAIPHFFGVRRTDFGWKFTLLRRLIQESTGISSATKPRRVVRVGRRTITHVFLEVNPRSPVDVSSVSVGRREIRPVLPVS